MLFKIEYDEVLMEADSLSQVDAESFKILKAAQNTFSWELDDYIAMIGLKFEQRAAKLLK